jgi:hypothetical protein
MSKLIALDADGVLLDYGLAYASAWAKAFGSYPREKNPLAYWPIDRWEVERLAGDRLEQLRASFDEEFWSTIPAIDGALQATHDLVGAGYELVCVTALPDKYASARQLNLQRLGFPIDRVYTTESMGGTQSPKAVVLNTLMPLAFVDDYLPYMAGVSRHVHRALIMRGEDGTPNTGEHLASVSSQHQDFSDFSRWLIAKA